MILRFHIGEPANPGWLTFQHDGYWFKNQDEAPVYCRYHKPRRTNWPIQRWYGITILNRWTFAFMSVGAPQKEADE